MSQPLPKDVLQEYQRRAAPLVALCVVDRSYDQPWLANRTRDCRKVFVDRHVPRILKCGVDTDKTLPWHEIPECLAMDDGHYYDWSHENVATPLERAAVEAQAPHDPDIWKKYTSEMDGYIRSVDDETVTYVAPDQDLREFADDDVALLRRILARQRTETHDAHTDIDPTGTRPLQGRWQRDLDLRWHKVRALVQQGLGEQDILGLSPTPASIMTAAGRPGATHDPRLHRLPGSDKVKSFQSWLTEALRQVVLAGDGAWTAQYLIQAAAQAAVRSSHLMGVVPDQNAAFARLRHIVGVTQGELQGICAAVVQQATRILGHSIMAGSRPARMVRDVTARINAVGVVRGRAMIGYATVKTYNTALLDAFRSAGVPAVGVVPEHVLGPSRSVRDAWGPAQWQASAAARAKENSDRSDRMYGAGHEHADQPNLSKHYREAANLRANAAVAFSEAAKRYRSGDVSGAKSLERSGMLNAEAALSYEREKSLDGLFDARSRPRPKLVEVLTAGDEFVCQTCQDISDNGPYTLDEADGLIPAHPLCRCAFVPTWDKRFAPVRDHAIVHIDAVVDAAMWERLIAIEAEERFLMGDFSPDELRDPHGRWTSGGASIAEFVSPNTENLNLAEAVNHMQSRSQEQLRAASQSIDRTVVGFSSHDDDVIGAWRDGAENSVMTTIHDNVPWEQVKLSAAMKGYIANQKQVLAFKEGEEGDSALLRFQAKAGVGEVHDWLLSHGLEYHTLGPVGDGTIVHIFAQDEATLNAAQEASKHYGSELYARVGHGEFIGTYKTDGTDAEQREDARKVYQGIIDAAGNQRLSQQWEELRDRYAGPTGKVGKVKQDLEKFFTPAAGWSSQDKADAGITALATQLAKKDVDADTFEKGLLADLATGKPTVTKSGSIITVAGFLADGGQMTRSIDFDKNEASHDYLKLPSSQTGKGEAKTLLSSQVALYQKLGLDRVQVHANIDVGGYAWAKYGFTPTPNSWSNLSDKLQAKIDADSAGSGYTPESWDELSSHDQGRAGREYVNSNVDAEHDYQIQDWRENDGEDDARSKVAEDFTSGDETEWADDAISDFLKSRAEAGHPVPYTADQLHDAITVEHDTGHWPADKGTYIGFDDDKLKEPAGFDPKQALLPGIKEVKPEDEFTEVMRKQLKSSLESAFKDRAEKVLDDMEPPDYLMDSARESLEESWSSMDDEDRFRWARDNTDLVKEQESESDEKAVDIPDKDRAAIEKLVQSHDPKAIWAISDSKYGKDLLLGSDWTGTLNLKDPQSMTRFNDYVGGKRHG